MYPWTSIIGIVLAGISIGAYLGGLIIVQGEQDEHVPLHQSRRLYDALHVKKHLELLPGADHQFTKREDFTRMTNVIADWLTSYLTAP